MTNSPKLTMAQQDALISAALRSALWLRHVAGLLDMKNPSDKPTNLVAQLQLEAGYAEEAALAAMLVQNEFNIKES